jgi:hypothetical protein
MAWLAYPQGIAFKTSSGYYYVSLPVVIPFAFFTAWIFQKTLVGRTYRAGLGQPVRTYDSKGSWLQGLALAALLAWPTVWACANFINQVTGTLYEASYAVTGKSIIHGKGDCYALTLTKSDDPTDQVKICISRPEWNGSAVGEVLLVSGRRSHPSLRACTAQTSEEESVLQCGPDFDAPRDAH